MNRESVVAPGTPGQPSGRGRHRAPSRPTFARRATVATVAMSAPLVPGAMIAAPAAHADTDWDALAKCESSGNWAINSGNGFSGGLQFTPSTWKAFGGTGKAENASREQQIAVAEKVKSSQGMTAWPVCSKKTGNTDSSPNSGTTKTVSSKKSTSKAAPKTTPKPKKDTGTKVAAARIEAPSGSSYTVKNGDTLSSVAASHGTTWKAMQDRNREVVTDPNMIFPGQTLSMV